MQSSSAVLLLLFLFVALINKICYIFADSELGLNFEPPTTLDNAATDHANNNKRKIFQNLTHNKVPGDKVGKMAAFAFQQFAPPELVYGAVTKLMEKVDRSVDLVDSTEYTTAFGFPCNPNEVRLCFKRTTTTTTEEPSLFKQRQEARRPHRHQDSHHHEPTDYELPPPQVTDFNLVIAQAREAFDRQTAMTQKLETERRKREFLDFINGESNDKELADSEGQKYIESAFRHSSHDYNGKGLKSEAIQNIVQRDAVSLRGWFPDVWTNEAERQKIETTRLRRLQSKEGKMGRRLQERTDGLVTSKTLLSDQPGENSSYEGRTYEESSNESADERIDGDLALVDLDQISSETSEQPSLSFWRKSWIETLLPSIIWDNLMVPDIIASWFNYNEEEDEEEDEEEEKEEDEEDRITDDILEILFISIGNNDNDSAKNITSETTKLTDPMLTISLPLSPIVDFPCFNISEATEKLEADVKTIMVEEQVNKSQQESNSNLMHYVRELGTTQMLRGEKEKSDDIENIKDAAQMEQGKLLEESHLFRDFRQIPDFFDFVSSMFPPFLQLEEFSIRHLLTTNNNKSKTNNSPGNKEKAETIVG